MILEMKGFRWDLFTAIVPGILSLISETGQMEIASDRPRQSSPPCQV
jgi:hypothetical protein